LEYWGWSQEFIEREERDNGWSPRDVRRYYEEGLEPASRFNLEILSAGTNLNNPRLLLLGNITLYKPMKHPAPQNVETSPRRTQKMSTVLGKRHRALESALQRRETARDSESKELSM